MEKFLDVLLDSLLDTAKLLPFLLIVYFLIEFLEYKNVFKFEKSKLLTGNASPVVGACFGTVPQCGFSVVSAELFSEKKMSLAALISVFLATSDEAIPILISNYKSISVLLVLILAKFIIAIIVGYVALFLSKKIFKNSTIDTNKENKEHEEHDENHHHDELHHIHACCHHDIENNSKFNWKHPLIHSFKIFIYILILNIILGSIIALIGEDKIAVFLSKGKIFQPFLALLIGFIPNCASSVILTELYMQGLLTFGSIITGLCANAGIGLLVLFKLNKNKKENIFIIVTLIVSSLVFGYIFHFLPINFLNI